MGVKVIKFGGSSVADADQLRKIRSIVEADADRRYIVVSAPGKRHKGDNKVTDMLIMLNAQAEGNIPYDQLFSTVKARYTAIAEGLGMKTDLDAWFDEIADNIEKGCSEAYIVSRGEYLSARLIAEYLNYDFVDTKNLVLFDSKGRLMVEETNEALKEEISKHEHGHCQQASSDQVYFIRRAQRAFIYGSKRAA